MTAFFALLRLQLLSRYADLKPRNLKTALTEKRGRTIGMFIAFAFLIIYLGVILYIIETKALDVLTPMGIPDMILSVAVTLATAGTLIMAFFFIMSSLYLGRDAAFLAAMPVRPRIILSAKMVQIWLSETLIDAVIILPACILYGTRIGADAGFYVRMVLVWLLAAMLPIAIASFFSAFLIRLSALWKRREMFMTVGGILLFVIYMVVMMNVGSITGDSTESEEFLRAFITENSTRISSMSKMFPPAAWATEGLLGNWGLLALYAAVSLAAMAGVIAVLGIFYRKLSLLQTETPPVSGKKGIQKGSIREGNAYKANVKRELLQILRVPSYATNILPVSFLPVLMVVMMSVMVNRGLGDEGQDLSQVFQAINPALVMCILTAVMAYMAGMNPALSTAVTREGRGHDFLKALPVSPKTLIHAKLTVGFGLVMAGVVAAGIALMVILPGYAVQALLAMILCLLYSFANACLAMSRDVRKPRLDWVTEQEAVKQNFGVLISMLISWGILGVLAILCYFMLDAGWTMIPVFGILFVLLAVLAWASYRILMKNVVKYYCAG